MKEEWLFPNAIVPVDVETTAALVAEIHRLIGVVGGMALAQPEQEPVAVKHMKAWVAYLKRKSDHGQHMKIPSEMSAGACWELAIELEQFINTHPPQRTWVGLTGLDQKELMAMSARDAVFATEAKLKEKNT
jgi:hypothetical protein